MPPLLVLSPERGEKISVGRRQVPERGGLSPPSLPMGDDVVPNNAILGTPIPASPDVVGCAYLGSNLESCDIISGRDCQIFIMQTGRKTPNRNHDRYAKA